MAKETKETSNPDRPELDIREFSQEEEVNFAKHFLSSWNTFGFGSLTKRDTELLVFAAMHAAKGRKHNYSQFEWASALRITPTQYKNLRLASYQRFRDIFEADSEEEDIGKELAKFLTDIHRIKLSSSGPEASFRDLQVLILIEDPVLRMHMEQKIIDVNGAVEYGRNRDILSIAVADYVTVASKLLGQKSDSQIGALVRAQSNTVKVDQNVKAQMDLLRYSQGSTFEKLLEFIEVFAVAAKGEPVKLVRECEKILKSLKRFSEKT
jgi:hypothetical protein